MKTGRFGLIAIALLTLCPHAVEAAEQTSVDLYCQTMVSTLIETIEYISKKPIPVQSLQKVEKPMLDMCLSTPAMAPKKLSSMLPGEISIVSCIGFAEGAYIAYQPKGAPDEPHSVLKARREFAANACSSNPRKFREDIFRRGPDFAMRQHY